MITLCVTCIHLQHPSLALTFLPATETLRGRSGVLTATPFSLSFASSMSFSGMMSKFATDILYLHLRPVIRGGEVCQIAHLMGTL